MQRIPNVSSEDNKHPGGRDFRQSSKQSVSTKSGSFAATIKREYGIIVGGRVAHNSIFSLYEAQVASEIGGSPKFLKVYNNESWPEDHQERVREMYSEKIFFSIKGSPKIHRVIDDGASIMLLLDAHGMSLYDHMALQRKTGFHGSTKKMECNLATWFTQILRSMSRASDNGIYFERINPEHTLYLNDKGHVMIADFVGSSYISKKSDTGFIRCRKNITDPMISAPEIDRLASGDVGIEEDSLISGEIWLAGAVIYNILNDGQSYPEYEVLDDGRRELIIPDSMGPPYSNEMRRFLKEVLEWEPEYRPHDHVTAVEHDWIIQNRREAMVPTMQELRNEYKTFVAANRGGLKKNVSQSEMSHAKKTFEASKKKNKMILSQGDKDIRDGCDQFIETKNLEREFISGYGWALTKYEKRIMDGSYNGLLPSSTLSRQPVESQRMKRAYKRYSNEFRSLTLYSDDYSQMVDQMDMHMEDVLEDVTPPRYSPSESEKISEADSSTQEYYYFDATRNLVPTTHSDHFDAVQAPENSEVSADNSISIVATKLTTSDSSSESKSKVAGSSTLRAAHRKPK